MMIYGDYMKSENVTCKGLLPLTLCTILIYKDMGSGALQGAALSFVKRVCSCSYDRNGSK